MKVLDLRCTQGHVFEGWFASGDAFESQLKTGLVECPICGVKEVIKLLAAPRLNLRGAKEPGASGTVANPEAESSADPSLDNNSHAAHWMRTVREVMAKTENVGKRFADEARKMHYGETEERGIRGVATRAQAEALVEEGINVMPLALPEAFKKTLQ